MNLACFLYKEIFFQLSLCNSSITNRAASSAIIVDWKRLAASLLIKSQCLKTDSFAFSGVILLSVDFFSITKEKTDTLEKPVRHTYQNLVKIYLHYENSIISNRKGV